MSRSFSYCIPSPPFYISICIYIARGNHVPCFEKLNNASQLRDYLKLLLKIPNKFLSVEAITISQRVLKSIIMKLDFLKKYGQQIIRIEYVLIAKYIEKSITYPLQQFNEETTWGNEAYM